MNWLLLVLSFFAGIIVSAAQVNVDVNTNEYGLDTAVGDVNIANEVCTQNGWLLDTTLEASCSPRLVCCDNGNIIEERYCDIGSVYVWSDERNDYYCTSTTSDAAIGACGITVTCTQDQMKVVVSENAIWKQTKSELQLGGSNNPDANCRFNFDGDTATKSINLNECGMERMFDWQSVNFIQYSIPLKRVKGQTWYEETNGATVTREKCFMATVMCYYTPDGIATSFFMPIVAAGLSQSGTNALSFTLDFVDDSNNTLTTPEVYTNDQLYIRLSLVQQYHQDIRISTRSCSATDPDDPNNVYSLLDDSCPKDTTFKRITSGRLKSSNYHEFYGFKAFRFTRRDRSDYVQAISITCDVLACQASDTSTDLCTSYGRSLCSSSRRRRRAIGDHVSLLSDQSRDVLYETYIVYPPKEEEGVLPKDMYMICAFVGSVGFACAGLALAYAFVTKRNQMKYRVLEVHQ